MSREGRLGTPKIKKLKISLSDMYFSIFPDYNMPKKRKENTTMKNLKKLILALVICASVLSALPAIACADEPEPPVIIDTDPVEPVNPVDPTDPEPPVAPTELFPEGDTDCH